MDRNLCSMKIFGKNCPGLNATQFCLARFKDRCWLRVLKGKLSALSTDFFRKYQQLSRCLFIERTYQEEQKCKYDFISIDWKIFRTIEKSNISPYWLQEIYRISIETNSLKRRFQLLRSKRFFFRHFISQKFFLTIFFWSIRTEHSMFWVTSHCVMHIGLFMSQWYIIKKKKKFFFWNFILHVLGIFYWNVAEESHGSQTHTNTYKFKNCRTLFTSLEKFWTRSFWNRNVSR